MKHKKIEAIKLVLYDNELLNKTAKLVVVSENVITYEFEDSICALEMCIISEDSFFRKEVIRQFFESRNIKYMSLKIRFKLGIKKTIDIDFSYYFDVRDRIVELNKKKMGSTYNVLSFHPTDITFIYEDCMIEYNTAINLIEDEIFIFDRYSGSEVIYKYNKKNQYE